MCKTLDHNLGCCISLSKVDSLVYLDYILKVSYGNLNEFTRADSWLRSKEGEVGLALLLPRALAAFLAVPFNREKEGTVVRQFTLLGS